MSISLCMLTKNEEKNLAKAINSVKEIVDEIVIVDTGSKDKTKEIAKTFSNKIYDFKWCDDFSKARNFSISKATKDWILILDVDEMIKKEDLPKIKELIKNKNYLGYRFVQKTYVERSETNRQAKNRTKIPPEANTKMSGWDTHKLRSASGEVKIAEGNLPFLANKNIKNLMVNNINKNKINNNKKVFYRGICRLFQNKKEIKL